MERTSRVPPVDDPRWEAWSKPVHQFLETPRDWKALKDWARSHHVGPERLRHYIAWLEAAGKAQSFYDAEGVLYWRALGLSRRSSVVLSAGAGPALGDLDEGAVEGFLAHRQ